MFTGRTAQLGEFDGRFGLKVIQGGAFSYVGKIPTKLERRLVPCSNASHVAAAIADRHIAGVVVTQDFAKTVAPGKALAVADSPMQAVQQIHGELSKRSDFFWESFPSQIDPSAEVHPTAFVEDHDVVIGPNTKVGPFSYIGQRSIIGANCRVGPHCTIGWESFELNANKDAPAVLPHVGGVHIEDNVELLSHCAVARCAFGGYTRIRRYTKLDSQILVAHDAEIGEHVRIAGGVTICGRVKVEDRAYLAPGSVVSNGVEIGERAEVSIGSVVARNVPAKQKVSGNFALPHTRWMKFIAAASR